MFITDVKGKTQAYGVAHCLDDSLIFQTAAGQRRCGPTV